MIEARVSLESGVGFSGGSPNTWNRVGEVGFEAERVGGGPLAQNKRPGRLMKGEESNLFLMPPFSPNNVTNFLPTGEFMLCLQLLARFVLCFDLATSDDGSFAPFRLSQDPEIECGCVWI